MRSLIGLIEHYGLLVVTLSVIIEQLGAPVPAYPALIVAGALSLSTGAAWPEVLLCAVGSAVVADSVWYGAGHTYGSRVLKILCRVSLSPDTCVRQTESIFTRWGTPSLMVAKFVPGFAAVATALAGVVRANFAAFLLFDAVGAALWSGLAIGIGRLFHDAIGDILDALEQFGRWGLTLLVIAFAAWLAAKWWQRWRLYRQLRMARITVPELRELLDRDDRPMIIDVRSASSQARSGRIPGSITVDGTPPLNIDFDHPRDGEVIVYCACPNEASAARVAKELMTLGFKKVRPLAGGIDAWIAAGLETDTG